MLIMGFDCAMHNLGVCCVEFDETWPDKLLRQTNRLHKIYGEISTSDIAKFIDNVYDVLVSINRILDNIINVVYFNVFDLIPEQHIKSVSLGQRTVIIKKLLCDLDRQTAVPDVVLVEEQMIHNDVARSMMHQIIYHYADVADGIYEFKTATTKNSKATVKATIKGKTSKANVKGKTSKATIKGKTSKATAGAVKILYCVKQYPIRNVIHDVADSRANRIVECCGTTLKNSFEFHRDGAYYNFIEKYSNYTANKKHTDWNFKYFIKTMGCDPDNTLLQIANKTNDIADAFMMIYGWLRKKYYL